MATLHLDTSDVMQIENIKQYIMQTFQINVQVVNDTLKPQKKKNILSDELDEQIRGAKDIDKTRVQKLKKVRDELNTLLDPVKKICLLETQKSNISMIKLANNEFKSLYRYEYFFGFHLA